MNIKVTDSGTTLLIAGETEAAVRLEIMTRESVGCRLVGSPSRVGSRWFATVSKPGSRFVETASGQSRPPDCVFERIGLQVIVRGPTEEAVRDAIANLITGGARVIAQPEEAHGEWTSVLDAPR